MALFNKNSVGIDISDRTLEIVEVKKSGNSVEVLNYNRLEIPVGIVEHGKILKDEELGDLLEVALKTAKPNPILNRNLSVFLPESQVFIFTKTILANQKSKIKNWVEEVLKEQSPFDPNDLIYTYKIRSEENGKIDLIIVASPSDVVAEWHYFFTSRKFNFENFDIEILADARAIISAVPVEPICLVDLGKRTSSVAIFDKKGLAYSYSMPQAGDALTQALVIGLGIKFEEAELQKISIGLKGRKADDKPVADILTAEVAAIIEDLQDTLTFFFQKSGVAVSKLYFLGGTSELLGLLEYVREHIKVQVEPAEVAPSIKLKGVTDAPFYTGAIGTAMRGLNLDPLGSGLVIIPSTKIKKTVKPVSVMTMPGEGEIEVDGEMQAVPEAPENWFKIHRKGVILAAIFILGIILLIGALFYQSYSRANRVANEAALIAGSFNYPQTVQIKLPLTIGSQISSANTVRGTIITKVWDPAITPTVPTATQIASEQSLASGLSIWPIPIRVKDQSRELTDEEVKQLQEGQRLVGVVYPTTFEWLVISDQDVQTIGLSLLKNKFVGNNFIFNTLKYDSIGKTMDASTFILIVSLEVSFNQPAVVDGILQADNFNEVVAPVVPEVTAPVVQKILILSTPTGYVYVRKEASTSAAILGRALTGESYDFVSEKTGWVQISFKGADGWVSGTYAKKQ